MVVIQHFFNCSRISIREVQAVCIFLRRAAALISMFLLVTVIFVVLYRRSRRLRKQQLLLATPSTPSVATNVRISFRESRNAIKSYRRTLLLQLNQWKNGLRGHRKTARYSCQSEITFLRINFLTKNHIGF